MSEEIRIPSGSFGPIPIKLDEPVTKPNSKESVQPPSKKGPTLDAKFLLRPLFLSLWPRGFREDNPIHDIIKIEAEGFHPSVIQTGTEKVYKIFERVKAIQNLQSLSPQEKIDKCYWAMQMEGFSFEGDDGPLLLQNLVGGHLDCDTTSFIILAIAHEMGWPVKMVLSPRHAFIRWDNGLEGKDRVRFNADYNPDRRNTSTAIYKSRFSISDQSIANGSYLRPLDRKGVLSLAYTSKAAYLYIKKHYVRSSAVLNRAIELDPLNLSAFYLRGTLKVREGDVDGAFKDLDRAIFLDPHLLPAHGQKAELLRDEGQLDEALHEYRIITALIQKNRPNFAMTEFEISQYLIRSLDQLSEILADLGRFDEAASAMGDLIAELESKIVKDLYDPKELEESLSKNYAKKVGYEKKAGNIVGAAVDYIHSVALPPMSVPF